MNNNNYLTLEYIFITSISIAVSALACIYGIAYYFVSDGFTLLEVSSLPLISLLVVFTISSICLFLALKRYHDIINKIKNVPYILGTVAITGIFIFIIDIFMYAFIDKTLSSQYIQQLEVVYKQYGKSAKDVNNLKSLPFILQNWILIFISLVCGSFSSLILLKIYKRTKAKSELMTA
ncbi:hypothetical protein [Chryseobacterium sp. JUb7]|uniref:hypothetical protein n=1 Tax=Chryseobacterium sp. JUb7 TaxID=2940599 RepID=UPI00216A5B49|nr:hypothetical protein [Chryseobacterium sp. JUb7]MCS3530809.1 hypothetical protein [Chryseobacterium sp. JUb7]